MGSPHVLSTVILQDCLLEKLVQKAQFVNYRIAPRLRQEASVYEKLKSQRENNGLSYRMLGPMVTNICEIIFIVLLKSSPTPKMASIPNGFLSGLGEEH